MATRKIHCYSLIWLPSHLDLIWKNYDEINTWCLTFFTWDGQWLEQRWKIQPDASCGPNVETLTNCRASFSHFISVFLNLMPCQKCVLGYERYKTFLHFLLVKYWSQNWENCHFSFVIGDIFDWCRMLLINFGCSFVIRILNLHFTYNLSGPTQSWTSSRQGAGNYILLALLQTTKLKIWTMIRSGCLCLLTGASLSL